MCCSKTTLFNYKNNYFLFNKRFLSAIAGLVITFNVFAFSAISQENQGKDDLLRASLKSALPEFYRADHPIYSFYINRNFKPFWIGNEKRLQSLTSIISEAELHGLPLSRYPLGELNQSMFETDQKLKTHIFELKQIIFTL